jgi:hypothetical protein
MAQFFCAWISWILGTRGKGTIALSGQLIASGGLENVKQHSFWNIGYPSVDKKYKAPYWCF